MLTNEEMKKLVEGTYINFSEDELVELNRNLSETMEIFKGFETFELPEDIEPLFYPNVQRYEFRSEALTFESNKDELLANTKESKDGYFIFPSVLKGEEASDE